MTRTREIGEMRTLWVFFLGRAMPVQARCQCEEIWAGHRAFWRCRNPWGGDYVGEEGRSIFETEVDALNHLLEEKEAEIREIEKMMEPARKRLREAVKEETHG